MAAPKNTGVGDLFAHAGAAPTTTAPTGVGDLFGHAAPAPRAPTAPPPPPPPAHHGGGGVFGFVSHIPGVGAVEHVAGDVGHAVGEGAHYTSKTVSGLASDAANIPGGVYQLGKAALAPGTHPSWGKLLGEYGYVLHHPSALLTGKGQQPDPLQHVMAGMGEQTWRSLTDPAYMKAHPDQTALSVFGFLSALGKAGEVGKAAAAGYRGEAVARATPRIVTVRPGGGEDTGVHTVHFLPSTNPVARHLVQGPLDRIVQHGLDNPEGRLGGFAAGRVGKALDEQSARQLRMQSAVTKRLEAAGSKAGAPVRSRVRGLMHGNLGEAVKGSPAGSRKVQQAALRLTAEQRTPEEALATHQAAVDQIAQHTHALAAAPDENVARVHQNALGNLGTAAEHERQIKLLTQIRDRGLVTQDETGHVVINPEHKLLQAVDARLARAGHINEAELAKLDHQIAAAPYFDRGGHLVTPTPEEVAAKAQQLAEGRRARIDAPNQVHATIAGRGPAEPGQPPEPVYVAPTPGRLGKPSPALLAARGYEERLQKLADRATARAHAAGQGIVARETGKGLHPAGEEPVMVGNRLVGRGLPQRSRAGAEVLRTEERTVQGPRTREDAQARLDQLEKEHQAALEKIAEATLGPIDKRAAMERGKQNAKALRQENGITRSGRASGASGPKIPIRPSLAQERLNIAEQQVLDAIKANPDNPAVAKLADRMGEIDQLRQSLYAGPDFIRDEGAAPADFGAKEETRTVTVRGKSKTIPGPGRVVTPPGGARAERLNAALSLAKERRQALEAAAARRVRQTGVQGTGAREGRQHVGYYRSEPSTGANAQLTRAPSPVVGRPQEAVSSHEFTGASVERAQVPDNTTGLAARHLARIIKQSVTSDFRRDVPGSLARMSRRDVLVNTQILRNASVSDELRTALGGRRPTIDELAGEHAAWEALKQEIVPILNPARASDGLPHDAAIGTEAPPGFKWVDRKTLGQLGRPSIPLPSRFGRFVDAANAGQTAATVYYKLGHVATRAGTDAMTNLVQGSLNPVAMTKAFRVWRGLSEEERDQALAGVGGGGFSALPQEGLGPVGRVARAGSGFWAHKVDAPSRFLALHYEATRSGFGSLDKFKALLQEAKDPSHLQPHERATVDGVFARADRAAIRYDGLNDFEKRYVQRAIWFYPWIKGATRFAGHTLVEHPAKSAGLGIAGANSAQQAARDLGPQPSYNAGYFKVGGTLGMPTVVNASTVSPLATPAEVTQSLLHANTPTQAEQLSSYLSPALGTLARAAFHVDELGRASKTGILNQAAKGVVSTTPELALIHGLTATPDNQARKMFPTDPREALLRFLIGSIFPRTMNVPVANRSAIAEHQAAGRK